ncbi:hypothetical protein PV328_012184, partial [Microctonus aethiopoides]
LFIDILKNQWDIPDPREPNVYPANYMVDTSMIDILWYIRDNNIRNQFIDVTLKSFRSVLSPLQAPLFYSYYIFASLYRGDEMSRDECVKQIGNIIPSLIDTFSVEFVTELIKVLIKCLKLLWKDDDLREEVTIDIIEGLLKLNIKDAITLPAVNVMLEVIKKINERCIKILRTLRTRKNPAAIAYACMQINKSNVANNNSPMYLEAIRNATDSTPIELSSGLPEIAIPFVKLEIEKILHPEEITERQKLDVIVRMEPSLYLQAIQNVAGSTPGEKYKTLNRIAREIVVLSQGQNDTIQVQLSLKVPEVLVPLV